MIRHGETDWNALNKLQGRTDIPLNTKGIHQAQESRDYLKNFEWDAVITSPLMRAKQTAEIINEGLNAPLVEMAEFIERSFGDAEGMTKQEGKLAFPDRVYPNQEEWAFFTKRLMVGLEKIQQEYPIGKVLVIAHGAVINAILAILSNGEIGSGKTQLLNACFSNIHYIEEKWTIKDYNQVSHLSSKD